MGMRIILVCISTCINTFLRDWEGVVYRSTTHFYSTFCCNVDFVVKFDTTLCSDHCLFVHVCIGGSCVPVTVDVSEDHNTVVSVGDFR